MQFTIHCQCGRAHQIGSELAGTQLACSCGHVTAVPNLSQLRVQAGEAAYDRSLPDVIAQQIADGELPGLNCVECHRPTDQQWKCVIECERPYVRDGSRSPGELVVLWIAYLISSILVVLWLLSDRRAEERSQQGRFVAVEAVVRLCPDCRRSLGWLTRRRMKRLLRKVGIYGQLLDEYPGATIVKA